MKEILSKVGAHDVVFWRGTVDHRGDWIDDEVVVEDLGVREELL